MVRILLTVPLVVPLALVDAGTVAESDPRQAYRFVVTASGMGQIEIRGLLTVDGKVRVLPMQRTPYTFECEAGTTITGYIESLTPGRTLNLKVIEPAYSRRRAAASGTKLDRVRFAWARPAEPSAVPRGSSVPPSPVVPGLGDDPSPSGRSPC